MSEKTIFKRIIDGDIPAHKIYEDDNFLVFLDAFPKSLGHTLVIPKQEVVWVWDVERYDELFQLVRDVARAQQQAFDTELIRIAVVGDEVPHAHVHVRTNLEIGESDAMEMIAERIKQHL